MANKQTIIGKTAPVPLGQQKAVNSLPVVFAEDQPPIPVEEQNKVQSEVALSLLGIPRAEVALGIFADVNTYDINPSEWSQFPLQNEISSGKVVTGLNHLDKEAGAELVAGPGKTTILTSKRFFRYQPGRVSSSTMGVKMNITSTPTNLVEINKMKSAPTIKKWGIFDKFDGYYFEIADSGKDNNFRCVRRTQALTPYEPEGIAQTSDGWAKVVPGLENNKTCDILAGNWGVTGEDPVIFRNGLPYVAAAIYDPSLCYSPDDVIAIEDGTKDLGDCEFNSSFAVSLSYRDGSNNPVYHLNGRTHQFPFDQQIAPDAGIYATMTNEEDGGNPGFLTPLGGRETYIRLDAHCKWRGIVGNLTRTGTSTVFPSAYVNNAIDLANVSVGMKYDPAPSEVGSSGKVWHLLVSTQGGSVTSTHYTGMFNSNDENSTRKNRRTTAYTPGAGTIGNRNLTLKEWFKLCVPKQYRMVYEYRPVRAMFSGDQLNGAINTVRWSDVSTANVDPTQLGVKRPGDPVILNGSELTDTSVYDIDFTKVTMWKIEFSWYGAVGALFLCYVPVGNGEARWVRVHHMRASNQLDVASLGNATLPITYLTHNGPDSLLGSTGSRLVKYGASYYIDGGDKGTVKLLSKSSDYAKGVKYATTTVVGTSSSNVFTATNAVTNIDQYIGSYLKADSSTRVIWVSGNNKLYFNQNVSGTSIELVVPRRQRAMTALRAKDNIINTSGAEVRNRTQIYPIKYSVGITDKSPTPSDSIVSLNFIKNPLLITHNLSANQSLSTKATKIYNSAGAEENKGFTIGSGTVPKQLTSANCDIAQLTGDLNADGKYFYAYVRSKSTKNAASSPFTFGAGGVSDPSVSVTESEILVRFFRKDGLIYVQNYQSQTENINIQGPIIPVRMFVFDSDGDITLLQGGVTHDKFENQKKWDASGTGTWESIASLSGAKVSQDFNLSPVANTGSVILSLYGNKGGAQYDLTDFFAYNKEYISFPLTNEVDILGVYALWESSSGAPVSTDYIDIVNSLSWEEQ